MDALPSWKTRCFASAFAIATLAAGISEARAQQAAAGVSVRHPPSITLVCPEVRSGPLKPCHARNRGVAVAPRTIQGLHQPTAVELDGLRLEPFVQFQLKREMLRFLGEVTRQSGILRAATTLRLNFSLRATAALESLARTRERATFIQIEEFWGPNPLTTSLPVGATFAGPSALLFGSSILSGKLFQASLGDALAIHPQPWPPGIQISGTFR
jgi:hypothetical protein